MNKPEPTPKKNDNPAIWDLVIEDMRERDREGQRKYGTRLQTHNGRDALIDAYQEALDLVVYLRQAIEERQDNKYDGDQGSHCRECGPNVFVDSEGCCSSCGMDAMWYGWCNCASFEPEDRPCPWCLHVADTISDSGPRPRDAQLGQ
jgi:hypothetical protein